ALRRRLHVAEAPAALAGGATDRWTFDEASAVIGHGQADYERARAALRTWRHFDLGWIEGFPTLAPGAAGELCEVFIDPPAGDVVYRLRAASRPRAALARIGRPIVRALQARFRRD